VIGPALSALCEIETEQQTIDGWRVDMKETLRPIVYTWRIKEGRALGAALFFVKGLLNPSGAGDRVPFFPESKGEIR